MDDISVRDIEAKSVSQDSDVNSVVVFKSPRKSRNKRVVQKDSDD